MAKLVLASNSPRRKELMKLITSDYEIITTDVKEIFDEQLPNEEIVMDLAFKKAVSVFKLNQDRVVLGFDTLVYLGNELLGKPKNEEEAKAMLRKLSGTTHIVYTGCAIISKSISKSFYEATRVGFIEMTEAEIEEYVASGEPMDKAGAYAIQGLGSKFVNRVNGDYFTVMGLPVSRLYRELKSLELL